MLQRFKNCVVNVQDIKFVSRNVLILEDGTRIETQIRDQFEDILEYFTAKSSAALVPARG